MDPRAFVSQSAGQVIWTPEGYHAFVPAPLPPAIQYDADLVLALSRADAALSELAGIGRTLPNPHLLITPYTMQEAVLSSRIEGTETEVTELFLEAIGEKTAGDVDQRREVRNYIDALDYGRRRLSELPLSKRLVCELHARLLAGVRGQRKTPGEFRRSQNWIGGGSPSNAVYVPPPVEQMHVALDAWESFLHDRDSLPVLIQCALMHEHFESIHPFLDGNGRVGRLLVTLFLVERGRLPEPLLYLSAFIDATRDDYYDLLQRIRTHGDWRSWILYFLRGVEVTAVAAAAQSARLMDLWSRYERELRDHPKAHVLVAPLFANPYMTVARAEQILGVSNPTARKAVTLLADRGLLAQVPESPWGRLYVAQPVLNVLRETSLNL
jgi:Fic family protein